MLAATYSPTRSPGSTIRAAELNDRVRDGNGCILCAKTTSDKHRGRETDLEQAKGREEKRQTSSGRDLCPSVCQFEVRKEKKTGQASRAISTARLHVLPRFHLPPINVLVSHGPSERTCVLGVLILEGASHLDAFSGYPFPTSLPGDAPGGTTGTRGVSPSRSSRTRDSSPQHSNAHDGYRPNCLTTF